MTQREVNRIMKKAIKLILSGFSKEADKKVGELLKKLKTKK